jgi:hypothetical protein
MALKSIHVIKNMKYSLSFESAFYSYLFGFINFVYGTIDIYEGTSDIKTPGDHTVDITVTYQGRYRQGSVVKIPSVKLTTDAQGNVSIQGARVPTVCEVLSIEFSLETKRGTYQCFAPFDKGALKMT